MPDADVMGFSAIDIVVLACYLAGITAFGLRFRARSRTVTDYFIGTRRTSWWVIALSIVATETSTLTLIGVPAIAYAHVARPEDGGNLTYLQVVAGYVIARVILAWLLVPTFFQERVLTAYEWLEHRFGPGVRRAAAGLFLVMRPLSEGVRVFAASLVLSAVLTVSLPNAPHLWIWSIGIVGLLTMAYTFEGGMAAVIWTDVLQLAIYVTGSIAAVIALWRLVPGGWSTVVTTGSAMGKWQVLSFSWDPRAPYTFWAGLIGGTCLTMASHGTDQLLVQRLLACRNTADGQRALIASGVIVFAQFALFLLVGIMLAAYYTFEPAPPLTSTDQIFPAFVVRSLPHGLSGLVIAAIFAAAMSNLSASLNALASTTVMDFYLPLSGRRADDPRTFAVSRAATLLWGVVLMGLAVVARGWGSVFTAGLTIASIVYGPLLGTFLLARWFRQASATGALAGLGGSLVIMIAVALFSPLAWTWYVLVGTVACIAIGRAVDALTRARVRWRA